MFILLLLAHLVFLYFFWKINFVWGMYLILFFLSIFFVISLVSEEGKGSWKDFIKKLFLEYLTYINFFVILVGLFFILNYFYLNKFFSDTILSYLASSLTIVLLCILIFLLFTFLGKNTYIKAAVFLQTIFRIYIFYLVQDYKIFEFYVAVMFSSSLVANLIYYVKFNKYNKFISYLIFLSFVVILFILINKFLISDPIILSVTIQIFIAGLLFFVIRINYLRNKLFDILEKLNKRQADLQLFGYSDLKLEENEEKFLNKHKDKLDFYNFVYDFFINSPTWFKVLLSLTNTIPILIATISFFYNYNLGIKNELFYWVGALLYFLNFLLFKKLNWFVTIQRLFAFFVINFVTYFTIIDLLGKNYLYIAIGGIVWNLFTTSVMLFIGKKNEFLEVVDYLIWSIVNFLALGVNLYFLINSGLNFYLTIGISLLYLGLYLFLYRIIYRKYFLS